MTSPNKLLVAVSGRKRLARRAWPTDSARSEEPRASRNSSGQPGEARASRMLAIRACVISCPPSRARAYSKESRKLNNEYFCSDSHALRSVHGVTIYSVPGFTSGDACAVAALKWGADIEKRFHSEGSAVC